MKIRKEYDTHGIEITRWNKGNLVYKIDCDCGRQADRVIGMYETFVCSNCHALCMKKVEVATQRLHAALKRRMMIMENKVPLFL
ncbi:hypothetical protein [Enterococcus faecalis]|uniref:hypothetical protein n=1 Tax=Enterococcus faecalis TaxID=1351 RepID=UPI002DBD3AA6|nr:hypothetical protein [Enterococcus faecalis]MEB7954639.1 hypothetical protein [Enterococcus faecalis]MEB7964809.1 hypothetical protein [Enterococcus faecalis]